MSILYIGLDDTDNLHSPGTGHLARDIALHLSASWSVFGITRHQLLNDPRVPMTAKNSANVIHLQVNPATPDLTALAEETASLMRTHYQPGSDPGLCLAIDPPSAVLEFGRRAQISLVMKQEAQRLAGAYKLLLLELGGDGGGVIGALAAVGLAATGDDGRFTLVGAVRDLRGVQPVEAVLAAGVASVQTVDGRVVHEGLIETGDKVRPALRKGRVVLLVEPAGDRWRAIRRD